MRLAVLANGWSPLRRIRHHDASLASLTLIELLVVISIIAILMAAHAHPARHDGLDQPVGAI